MHRFALLAALIGLGAISGCQSKIGHPAEAVTLQGCIGFKDGSYTLNEDTGKEYVLASDSVDLKQHVGHEALVRGAEIENAQTPGAPPSAVHGVHSQVVVTSAKSVAPQCSK